ncbi:MAG: hypothetical protein HUJ26_19025 [Planctomycetaceae bacterium]|nr:hypothetical protein [Planctomycetaceae bacterium]
MKNEGVIKKRLRVCSKCDIQKFGRCESNNKLVADFATYANRCPEYRWPGDPERPEPQKKPEPPPEDTEGTLRTPHVPTKPEPRREDEAKEEAKERLPEIIRRYGLNTEQAEQTKEELELINQPIPRDLLKEAEPADIGRIAILTSYFNPEGYRRIRENYLRFREEMARYDVDLFIVELAFDHDPFEIEDSELQIRGKRKEHKLWQKEQLLNLLIDKVPEDYDAIGWFDCDILFQNRDWTDGVRDTLSRYTWCQPYAGSWFTETDGSLTNLKHSMGWFLHHDPENFLHFGKAHPGFAWVGRADWVRKNKLCPTNVTGGGDALMVKAITERLLFIEQWMNPEWIDDVAVWASQARASGGRHFGYVPGDVIHLYHGTRSKRKYRERWCYLTDHDYNPRTDIEVDPETQLLRWSEEAWRYKPEMIARVSNYFGEREEDD